MKYAIIFAIMSGHPTVMQYGGNVGLAYDLGLAREISFGEAERRVQDDNPPILFAMPGDPVIRGTRKQGLELLKKWKEAKGDKARMRAELIRTGRAARNRLRQAKGYVQD